MTYDFLIDSYESERVKVVSVWSEFRDGDLTVRPRQDDSRGRSVQEHMVHQCVSEDAWFRNMLGIDVGGPPLPDLETRLEFMKRYAQDSGKRLQRLRQTDECWWESPTAFFNVQRTRAWVMTRRLTHTSHHRGQQMAMLRMLGRDLHSNYGPTADTGGLTNPTAHGASAADAFHLVIPSLPGYGFSGKPTTPGWDPARIARAWVVLMKRLGYTRFAAQGGDWGAVVVDMMGVQAPTELIGIHTNMPGAVPPDVWKAIQSGGLPPSGLSDEETDTFEKLKVFFATDVAYALEMGTRPQTLYGIADSPVGLAAWILDHDMVSYALMARVFDGHAEGLTRDDVLDSITHYWLTNTGISSSRLYWEIITGENKLGFFDVKGVSIPVAVSVFPDEIDAVPRSWAERAYPKLIHYNKVDKGGHFAAWEQPQLFSEEVRAGFRSLR
jgi:pimeloyl-ACP methyl ester carboxylesterase/uncharacterized damage-inducible protein DinB